VHAGHEVVHPVVDHFVGTEFARDLELIHPAHRRDHAGSERLADLHGCASDTASGGVNQERLAGLQIRAKNQRRITGRIDDRNRCAFPERHLIGHPVDISGRNDRGLRKTADLRPGENAITHRESLDSRAERFHHARDLAARRKREIGFDLVFALDDQGVEEVATGGAYFDLERARSGFGFGDLRHPKFGGFHIVVD